VERRTGKEARLAQGRAGNSGGRVLRASSQLIMPRSKERKGQSTCGGSERARPSTAGGIRTFGRQDDEGGE